MVQFSLWDILAFMLGALRWTVALSLIAFVGGGLVGMGLLLLRFAKLRGAAAAVGWSVQIVQGTPLGMDTSPLVSAAICLTLYASAYLTEIWRGCVNAIPKGQWEASTSLALNFRQQMRHVILPQALRVAIAPTVGFLVQIIKGTALASVIGFVELTKAGQMISNATYQPFLAYTLVGLLYFALCYPLSWWSQRLENRRLA